MSGAYLPIPLERQTEPKAETVVQRSEFRAFLAFVGHLLIEYNLKLPREPNTGWKPMLLYAVASSLRVHGASSLDGSGRLSDSPKSQ
jgi:hypothetical protein